MSYNTIIQQGRFTSDGANRIIPIRSDVDFMWVYNFTEIGATNNTLVYSYWQRGMADGTGIQWFKSGGANTMNSNVIAAPRGFFLIDTTGNPTGNAVAVTAVSNVVQPITTTGNTGSLATGSVVRLNTLNNNLANISGFDFEVDTVTPNTSFRMRWALANAPGAAATTGFYRHISFDPIFYPRSRFIVNITQAAQAVVRFSVAHGYTVGQEIRFTVPAEFGMTQMDGLVGVITAINTGANTATVNINSTLFTSFTFPVAAAGLRFTFAQASPLGIDTSTALTAGVDYLADATRNTGQLGMLLAGGVGNPAGSANDVIYWNAGKSFSVTNE